MLLATDMSARKVSLIADMTNGKRFVLVIDEVDLLGGTTLYEASCRLQSLCDYSGRPFCGLLVVLLMGAPYQLEVLYMANF